MQRVMPRGIRTIINLGTPRKKHSMSYSPLGKDGRISKPSILQMPEDIIDKARQNVLKSVEREFNTKSEAALILIALGLDTAQPREPGAVNLAHYFTMPESLLKQGSIR